MQPGEASSNPVRAMTSVVSWTVLGLVIEAPGYGRELYLRYQELYEELRSVSESQIYAALDALESRGLIEKAPGISSGRQPRVRYRALEAGLQAYADWLVAQIEEECLRQELWVRQFGILAPNREVAADVLRQVRQKYVKRASQYRNEQFDPDGVPSVDELVAERRRIVVGGILSWLRYANTRFDPSGPDDEPPRT